LWGGFEQIAAGASPETVDRIPRRGSSAASDLVPVTPVGQRLRTESIDPREVFLRHPLLLYGRLRVYLIRFHEDSSPCLKALSTGNVWP
jgi:hypothetical protein